MLMHKQLGISILTKFCTKKAKEEREKEANASVCMTLERCEEE